jgi:hypothetical protein
MVLLTEQVRQIAKEQSLIEDATQYVGASASGWATMKDYGNITLSEDAVIALSYDYGVVVVGGGTACNHRLKIGGTIVCGFPRNTAGPETVHGVFFLAAGTYDVLMEGATDWYDANNYRKPYVQNFKLGKASLSDVQGCSLAVYSAAITKNLPIRKTCIGTVKNGNMIIIVSAYTPGTYTTFQNVGEGAAHSVAITVDGVQRNWTERRNDNIIGSFSSLFGAGLGRLHVSLAAGSNHTVSIGTSDPTTVVNISLCYSPWLLSAESMFEPVSLDFPQGSTLYVVGEPLSANPTKNIRVGKKRAVSFGSATDYYSAASGTDILSWSYTFEIVEVTNVVLVTDGWGGCVGAIGVDVR